MVVGLWMLLCRIGPGFEYFQDEEVELVDEPGIDHLALKVGEAFDHQGRRHTLGWRRRKAESLEFVHVSARTVTDSHDLGRQFQRWDGQSHTPS